MHLHEIHSILGSHNIKGFETKLKIWSRSKQEACRFRKRPTYDLMVSFVKKFCINLVKSNSLYTKNGCSGASNEWVLFVSTLRSWQFLSPGWKQTLFCFAGGVSVTFYHHTFCLLRKIQFFHSSRRIWEPVFIAPRLHPWKGSWDWGQTCRCRDR